MLARVHPTYSDAMFGIHNNRERSDRNENRGKGTRSRNHEHDDHLQPRRLLHWRTTENRTSHHPWDRYNAEDTVIHKLKKQNKVSILAVKLLLLPKIKKSKNVKVKNRNWKEAVVFEEGKKERTKRSAVLGTSSLAELTGRSPTSQRSVNLTPLPGDAETVQESRANRARIKRYVPRKLGMRSQHPRRSATQKTQQRRKGDKNKWLDPQPGAFNIMTEAPARIFGESAAK